MHEFSDGDVSRPADANVAFRKDGSGGAVSVEAQKARGAPAAGAGTDSGLPDDPDEAYASYLENGGMPYGDRIAAEKRRVCADGGVPDLPRADPDSPYDAYTKEMLTEYALALSQGEQIEEAAQALQITEDGLDSEPDNRYNEYIDEAKKEQWRRTDE